MTTSAIPAKSADADGAPAKAKAVLATLIIVAAVSNLPLAMANVALPSIGAYFDASQTQLNLVAVAYSLGLACSVLWLGALFNSLFGALLAAGYAAAMTAAIAAAPEGAEVPAAAISGLTMSYAGAQSVAAEYPQYAAQITAAAKTSFLAGDQYAYLAGILAVLLGAALVSFIFPKRDKERELLMAYHQQDMAAMAAAAPAPAVAKAAK